MAGAAWLQPAVVVIVVGVAHVPLGGALLAFCALDYVLVIALGPLAEGLH